MILLNPKHLDRYYPDERSRAIMQKTVAFFEQKGKQKLKADDYDHVWYADLLDFVKREGIFATLLTPAGYGDADARWDTWRNCEFNEILGFYGLPYWYTWQVTILGLGPIWMSPNEKAKQKAADLLKKGAIFAFGLSEKAHGADIYSTDMILTPDGEGGFTANGGKYYIGNGNEAGIVSVFGRRADVDGADGYVFFAADSHHDNYELVRNVVNSQSYVSQFNLKEYPVEEADVLHTGPGAFDAALNTVNIGKFNLGFASIGIAEHAFYEAITHAIIALSHGLGEQGVDHADDRRIVLGVEQVLYRGQLSHQLLEVDLLTDVSDDIGGVAFPAAVDFRELDIEPRAFDALQP